MQKRSQHANQFQHILRLAEEERLHDNAVESVLVRDAVAVAASGSSAASLAAYDSPCCRVPPDHEVPTTRIPAAAVAEPGARRKSCRRGSAGIAWAHHPLLPVPDGEVRAAERATHGARLRAAREGWWLAPGGVRVQRAVTVALPSAARSPAQGSILLGPGLGVWPSARRRRRSQPVTRIKHGVLHVHKDYEGRLPQPLCVTMTQDSERAGRATVTRHGASTCETYYGHTCCNKLLMVLRS